MIKQDTVHFLPLNWGQSTFLLGSFGTCLVRLSVVDGGQTTALRGQPSLVVGRTRVTNIILNLRSLGSITLARFHLLFELPNSGLDPRVTESIFGRHTHFRFPREAFVDEVHKIVGVR